MGVLAHPLHNRQIKEFMAVQVMRDAMFALPC